jgi:PAS domain S-box-containing protein
MINPDERLAELKGLVTETAEEMARSEALFLSIGEGAIATDAEGRIERLNKVTVELLGFNEQELIGKPFRETIIATDDWGVPLPSTQRPITLALKTSSTVQRRSHYRCKDGSLLPVLITVSPIVLGNRTVGAVEVFRDISQDVEIEKTKSDFISIASHQLRTPATAVKMYLSMLLDGYAGKMNDKQAEYIRMAFNSNERQLHIVNDLLSTASAEAGKLRLTVSRVNVSKLVKRVVDEFLPTFKERKQTIHVNIAEGGFLRADSSYLKMVIENLLSNASKYTDRGGHITVTLENKERSIVLKVKDTGVGINAAQEAKLFRKFSRIDNPLSSEAGGSGIGLYLLKQIIDLHGGEVSVKSKEGQGTTFTVRLPKKAPLLKRDEKGSMIGGR